MRLYRYAELRELGIPYSRMHLRRLVAAGRFPAPLRLSAATIAWRQEDLDGYIARCVAERDAAVAGRATDATA